MGIEEIRRLKSMAGEPKIKKIYSIPKVSEKKKLQIVQDKEVLAADKIFYAEIWLASPHMCQCGCKKKLGKEPLTIFFHHLLEKAQYPEHRHTPENIMIVAPECHTAYHTNPDNRPEIKRRRVEAVKQLLK